MNSTINLKNIGCLRVGVATPELQVADVVFNRERMLEVMRQARHEGCQVLLFPELALTGYSCGDLFYQPTLLAAAAAALGDLAIVAGDLQLVTVVGLPVACDGKVYNSAAVLAGGIIAGVVPKTFLPGSQEFYEERWFSSARQLGHAEFLLADQVIPFGADLLFRAEALPDCCIGVELCEDLWSVSPPSGALAARGATLILNPSASPEILAKEAYRRQLVGSQSARCLAAYAYASAGPGESSTDLVYSGHSLIYENGQLLTETKRFQFTSQLAITDVDLERLQVERYRNNSFADALSSADGAGRRIQIPLGECQTDTLLRPLSPTPFVPAQTAERDDRCREIFSIQTSGLAKRLRHTRSAKAVIGISGGLDSTLALLVTVKAFDLLQKNRSDIVALTMPGFGTTLRTRSNAEQLAELLGVTLKVIPIDAAVRQHFADIDHSEFLHDVTYENAQARERTQILMDIANQLGGLVVGTGDLSELALGWCTYNADHMSMYGVNAGVPKTLVRYLVDWCAEAEFSGPASTILHDIGATPVSPELLPPDENGDICQKTEEKVGPYILHDFFLYYLLRLHTRPGKLFLLARQAFAGQFSEAEILRWLKLFYQRFFSQQFKRSCLPDGPKVGSVALSPRGDWRMPSDAVVKLWLDELESLTTAGK